MPNVELPQAEFKVVLLGDTHTGKTSLVLRFVEGNYREGRSATVGAFFLTKRLTLSNMTCKLLLWDTAGQEQFQKLAVTYYRQAAAAIVCYDVSSRASLPRLQAWLDQVQQNVTSHRIVLCVAACKGDLPAAPGIEEQAQQLAQSYGALYIKTSAKTNHNVSKVFQRTAESVLQCQQDAAAGRGRPIHVTMGGGSMSLTPPRNSNNRSLSPMQRTEDAAAASPTRSHPHHPVDNNNKNNNNDSSTTATDSDDHVAESNPTQRNNKGSNIMCDSGMLVCGSDGSGQDCVIL